MRALIALPPWDYPHSSQSLDLKSLSPRISNLALSAFFFSTPIRSNYLSSPEIYVGIWQDPRKASFFPPITVFSFAPRSRGVIYTSFLLSFLPNTEAPLCSGLVIVMEGTSAQDIHACKKPSSNCNWWCCRHSKYSNPSDRRLPRCQNEANLVLNMSIKVHCPRALYFT